MRVALQATSLVIFNQDAELKYTWVYDPASHFPVKDILGRTDADFLPAQEAAALTAIKRQVLESGRGTRRDVRISLDGKPTIYDLTVEPLSDAPGVIIGITCAMMEKKDSRPTLRPN